MANFEHLADEFSKQKEKEEELQGLMDQMKAKISEFIGDVPEPPRRPERASSRVEEVKEEEDMAEGSKERVRGEESRSRIEEVKEEEDMPIPQKTGSKASGLLKYLK